MTESVRRYTANQPLMLGGQIYMWNRYSQVDALVHMVEAQFTKSGHQNRIDLINNAGVVQPFVVPLSNRNFKPLNEVFLLNPTTTLISLQKTFQNLYSKTLEGDFKQRVLKSFEDTRTKSLAEINVAVTNCIFEYLFEGTKETYQSNHIVPNRSINPSEWVAELGFAINCTEYLGGDVAAKAYLKDTDFTTRGMKFTSQHYKMKPYKLKKDIYNTNAFVSILDLIFRQGKKATQEIIQL